MVGDILREEREKQNMSIHDVERETSIRVLYISSIEEGKYDVIPGEVYLRGFIKTYANFLKLDANKLLQEYKAERAAENAPEVNEQGETLASPTQEELDVNSERPSLREKMEEKRQRSSLYTKVAIGAVAVVIVGLAAYWTLGTSPDAATDKVTTEKPSAASTEPPRKAPASDAQTKKPTPVADKFVAYQAKYTDDCWTKVEADGKVVLEETVKKGTVLDWKAEKSLVITAGNAGAVEITANGKSLGRVGAPGEVITKKFTGEKTAP